MSDFTFSAGGECELCGKHLPGPDDDCDHDGQPIDVHIFRRLREPRESMKGVKSAPRYKWHKLAEKVGEDWIAYQYLGTRESVDGMLSSSVFGSFEELPVRSMSLAAPDDVKEKT